MPEPKPTDPKPRGLLAVKEGLTSVVIAFALAFVFRGFVLEAFLIPTGSMAPTLLGQHHRFTSATSGYQWTIGPWRGGEQVRVNDPMVGSLIQQPRGATPRLAGDRIFVLKYLPPIYPPQRWDVSVFKYPPDPRTNYIKRLLGLPNEQIALIDGDVFVRPSDAGAHTGLTPPDTWNADGWTIARKPERVQRAVWQDVWDSRYTPANPVADGRRWFQNPWRLGAISESDASGWSAEDERVFRFAGAGEAAMVWDHQARPITDATAYNQTNTGPTQQIFPVSDVATLVAVEPEGGALGMARVDLLTRRHAFRAIIESGAARLEMRPALGDGAWTTLATGELPEGALEPGRVTPIEFWHHDQRLTLWVDGAQVAQGDYDWTPVERVRQTFDLDLADETLRDRLDVRVSATTDRHPFADPRRVRQAQLAWRFEGGPFTLHRSVVKRDLHYQPGFYDKDNDTGDNHPRRGQPSLATHPGQTPTLGPDQFLLLGDNSPASADGRVWAEPSPWVSDQIDDTMGVVHRDLLIGKAFIVYFPAPHPGGSVPIPDAGRVRWIF